jgi:hypothetical protein
VIRTDVSEPERRLLAAFPRGAWVDLRSGMAGADRVEQASQWGTDRVIRAEFLQALLLGACDSEPGYAPAVRLRGALVTGRLDLMGATVTSALVCEFCHFDEELRLVESSTKTVRIVDSYLPAFNGTRMRLEGILNLWGCTIPGVTRIEQAKVAGQVCLRGAITGTAESAAEAIAADGLIVDGGIDCVDLSACGSVSLRLARVAGSVDLSGARISLPGHEALIADNAEIDGRLDCRELAVDGETRMHNTRVGSSFVMSGARLSNQGGLALSAGGLSVGGGVFLYEGFTGDGEVRMVGARLRANLTMSGATLRNAGGIALNLDRASMSVLDASDLSCTGSISMISAQIASDVNLRRADIRSGTEAPVVVAERASVGGALLLEGLRAHGELNFRTILVGQRVLLTGSNLVNPLGTACRLSRSSIAADLFCDDMSATGRIRLAGAAVGGSVYLKNAQIRNPGGLALDAAGLHAREVSLRTAEPVEGLVDLSHGQFEIIKDDPARWPAELSLEGTTYQALEPTLPARDRLSWLGRDPGGHEPRAYEQLAAYYSAIGQPAQARLVMYARERSQARAKPPLARIWSLLQDVTVGYGYQPGRALAWLIVLLTAGSVTFALAPPPPLQASAAPHFNPVIYSLDLLLPVVNLGQKYAFNPSGAEQWLTYLLIAGGWILVTTIAAGAARVLSRR